MTTINGMRPPEITPETTTWEVELQKVGLVRRILNARHWYGADWWFVAISSVLVAIFIIIAVVPTVFAPYASRCAGRTQLPGTRCISTCSSAGGPESPRRSIRLKDLAVTCSSTTAHR